MLRIEKSQTKLGTKIHGVYAPYDLVLTLLKYLSAAKFLYKLRR